MSNQDSMMIMIREAIFSHIRWKERIEAAVRKRCVDVNVDEIANYNICSFGKWLYSDSIPLAMIKSDRYQTVCDPHAAFHRKASELYLYLWMVA